MTTLEEQRVALLALEDFLQAVAAAKSGSQDAEPEELLPRPRTAAIVGPRGVGKSTVLGSAHQRIREAHPNLICTEIVDASTIREDTGLLAASIQEIWETCNLDLSERDRQDQARDWVYRPERREAERDLLPAKEAQRKFQECFEAALLEEESHRTLALELAMTPGHYASIVQDAASRRRKSGEIFRRFVDSVLDIHDRHLKHLRATRPQAQRKPAQIVLFWDDLDLTVPSTIRNWTRALLTQYQHPRVTWILAFDRNYLVQILSRREPEKDDGLDVESGRALLQKLVPTQCQWELRPWSDEGRETFHPETSLEELLREEDEDAKGDDTDIGGGRDIGKRSKGRNQRQPSLGIKSLLQKKHQGDLLPLLPGNLRSLRSLYYWLEQQEVKKEDSWSSKSEAFLRRVAKIEGEERLLYFLNRRGAAHIGRGFHWPNDADLQDVEWLKLVENIQKDKPLRELPLPTDLQRDGSMCVTNLDPETVVEICLDVGLAQGTVTPYQILRKLGFLRERLERAIVHAEFFKGEVIKFLRYGSEDPGAALGWQSWSVITRDSKQENREDLTARLDIGAKTVWEFSLGLRPREPSEIFNSLYIPRINAQHGDYSAVAESLIPMRLRGLILLIDGLLAAPWSELQSLREKTPISVTRCAILLILSGYLQPLDTPSVPPLLTEEGLKSWLERDIDDEEIARKYKETVHSLHTENEGTHLGAAHYETPATAAKSSIGQALSKVMELPLVRKEDIAAKADGG